SHAVPADWGTMGVKVRNCDLRLGHQSALAGIKHLNRLENVLAAAEWDDQDIAEGLLLDATDNVVSGTRSNLFLIKSNQIITPDLSRCGVAGVQRSRVLSWATQHGYAQQIRDVHLNELFSADELFLVNSIIGLWPIRQLKQSNWAGFPIAMQIRHHLEAECE
ncbi:MAG: aminotransferase class IV, partial [Gallionella sp.]